MTVTAFLIHGASGQNLSYPAPAPATAEPADVNTWKVRLCQLAGGRLGTEQARLYGWLYRVNFDNFYIDVHRIRKFWCFNMEVDIKLEHYSNHGLV